MEEKMEKKVVGNAEANEVENGEIKTANVKKNKKEIAVSYITKISFLSAIGVVLMMLKFPILPAVSHLEFNLSDVPVLIASFMFGPVSGIVVNAVKVGIYVLTIGTKTAYIGDLSNLISGTVYAVVAGLIYKFHKSKKGAILSLITSSVGFCIAMWLCNQFLLLPWAVEKKIIPVEAVTVTLWWTLLFNVIRSIATGLATFYVYKGLHKMFNKF